MTLLATVPDRTPPPTPSPSEGQMVCVFYPSRAEFVDWVFTGGRWAERVVVSLCCRAPSGQPCAEEGGGA